MKNNKLIKQNTVPWKKYALIFAMAILSRWIAYALGYIAMHHNMTGFFSALKDMFADAGDTPRYIEIAQNGYHADGESHINMVFFPLYPLLMRIFQTVFRSYLFSGILVSNLCFGAASCYVYELLKCDFDEEKAYSGLLALWLFPFGVFFWGIYTESLFVLMTAMTLYYMRKEKLIPMAVCGFFAALTRTQGMLLIIPIAYELIVKSINEKKFDIKNIIPIIAPVLGFGIYLTINKIVFDDWFKYLQFQADKPWYNSAKWIGGNLKLSYDQGVNYEGLAYIIYWAQLLCYAVSLGAMFYGFKKKIRISYIAYAGAYTAVTFFHGWLISGTRYTMSCLPLYIIFASIENKYVKNVILLLMGMLYMFATLLWMKGYSIM